MIRSSLSLLSLALLFATTAQAADFSGVAHAIDGDTIAAGDRSFHLTGIDAWELGQKCPEESNETFRCGAEAHAFLQSLIESKTIYCAEFKNDGSHGASATCFMDGRDLSDEMVRNGWAIITNPYGKRYTFSEKAARLERRGGWRGLPNRPPEAPSAWRSKL